MIYILPIIHINYILSFLLSSQNNVCLSNCQKTNIYVLPIVETQWSLSFLLSKTQWSLFFLLLNHIDLCPPYWQYTMVTILFIIRTLLYISFLLSKHNDLCPVYCCNTMISFFPFVIIQWSISSLICIHFTPFLPIVKTQWYVSFIFSNNNDFCPSYC